MHNKPVAPRAGIGSMRPALAAPLLSLAALAVLFAAFLPFAATASAHVAPASPTTAEIVGAKSELADLYDRYLRGESSLDDVHRAERRVSELTGQHVSTRPSAPRFDLGPGYTPFRQETAYYCGPSTVEGILWFLAGSGGGPGTARLSGAPGPDQRLLAADDWLGTERMAGTSWGDVIPDTINRWRGNAWYAPFGTPNVGGSLDKDQAMQYIQYAIDHGFPVAANVMYSPATFTPAGFAPGYTYYHWETIAGYFDRDGRRYVRIGASYAAPGMEYVPIQEIPWDDYWPAIGQWYGLVW